MSQRKVAELREIKQQHKKDMKKHEAKILRLKSRITEHDLEIKLKSVRDWLEKGTQVKSVNIVHVVLE